MVLLKGNKIDYLKAVGTKIKTSSGENILLRGFGLGGWLLPEGYMWKLFTKCDRPRRMESLIEGLCGKEFGTYFWRRYFDSYIRKQDIELIARQGFNCVRLPMNARHINEEILRRIDQLISWCREYGVYVILDMHAAPGGQTGTNIDDSENDTPCLFIEERYQEELISLWGSIARRYAMEPAVAGYDLLNEPLPNWFSIYNHMVVPLYRKIIAEIRRADNQHLIILEGIHWATNWDIFNEFEDKPVDDNIMLQFHKYWNSPDEESLEQYTNLGKKLNLPIFMGEGGENNLDWYTGLFPMLTEQDISWSFWTYKKMDCSNSPVSFPRPKEWSRVVEFIDGEGNLSKELAESIFDELINNITNKSYINMPVFRALNREAPLKVPAEYFSGYNVMGKRCPGASLRSKTPVNIQFVNGKKGEPDYRRYGGEEQPEEERLCTVLEEGGWLEYNFHTSEDGAFFITVFCIGSQCAALELEIDDTNLVTLYPSKNWDDIISPDFLLKKGDHKLKIKVKADLVKLQYWQIDYKKEE